MLTKLRNLYEKAWKTYKDMPVSVKAMLWYVVCSILQKGISLIATPIFTRVMSTEQYGQFALYSSWLGIFTIFVTLNLQYGSFNTAQVKFSNDRKAYVSSIQGLVTCMTLIGVGIFVIFRKQLQQLIDLPQLILVLMVVDIWAQFAVSLWMADCRFDNKYKSVIVLTLILCTVGIGLGLVAVLNSQEKGYARIYGAIAVECAFGFGVFLYNILRGKRFFSRKYWKYALSFNTPLIPYYLAQVIFNQSDRIMIADMVGVDKSGIYTLAHNIAFLLVFVINAVRNVYVPKFFQMMKSNDTQKAKRNSTRIMLMIAGMLLLFILIGPELLLIMGGRTYFEAVWIIPPLVAAVLFEYFTDFSVNILFFYEKKWVLTGSTIGCAVVNVVLNYFGIKWFGYQATAYATLFSYFLFWLFLDISARVICKKQGMDAESFLCSKLQMLLAGVFLVLMVACLLLYINNYIRYTVIGLGLIAVLIYSKKIIAMMKTVLMSKSE